jgi:ferredoxin-type protein NapH
MPFYFPPMSNWILLSGALLLGIILIVKRWKIPGRGFTQMGLFILGEAAFCSKGIPCATCPLSFGLCPVGAAQRISFMPEYPKYVILAAVGVIGLIFGTLSCGWACPVGFIQDIFGAVRLKEIRLPKWLTLMRYPSLITVIILITLELTNGFLTRRGFLLFHEVIIVSGWLILALALFLKRPFCRTLCPLGLIYGLCNKISAFKVDLNRKLCATCGKCNEV